MLCRAMKKSFIAQMEADDLSENLFKQFDTKNILGFLPSPFGEQMRAGNPYISMTGIAKEKKNARLSYLNSKLDVTQYHD